CSPATIRRSRTRSASCRSPTPTRRLRSVRSSCRRPRSSCASPSDRYSSSVSARSVFCALSIALGLCGCRSAPTSAQPLPPEEHSTKVPAPTPPPARVQVLSATNVVMLHAQDEHEERDFWLWRPQYSDIVGGARIVLRAPSAQLLIDYPLHKPAVFDL